jgi:hypothetical protein
LIVANAKSKWSIGIYSGSSPVELSPHPAAENPVLSCLDVSDVSASFIADPFMARSGNGWHMFFEVLNSKTNKGEIGLATSRDGLRWIYDRIVLAEPFHISYPYVFNHGGDYYLMPESEQIGKVQLYRATTFPHEWKLVATMLDIQAADASIFFYGENWWMFACTTPYKQDTLRLYMSDDLTSGWQEHPLSPIVGGNMRTARPAGRPVTFGNRLVRYAQDCSPEYGTQVRAFEITELTRTTYSETESHYSPVLKGTGEGWNARRMHHVDPHMLEDDSWIACVDGDYVQNP